VCWPGVAACVRARVQMMRAEVTKYNKRFGIVKVAATGYVGSDLVVEAELTLAMAKQ
jgi:3-hydroxyacyl-[acyl-carrier-protein] dehydratase